MHNVVFPPFCILLFFGEEERLTEDVLKFISVSDFDVFDFLGQFFGQFPGQAIDEHHLGAGTGGIADKMNFFDRDVGQQSDP